MLETSLSQELVPLQEAVAVAYRAICDRSAGMRQMSDISHIRGQMAMALAAVGRVVAHEGAGTHAVSLAELESRFTSSFSARNVRRLANPDLSHLYIGRSDLVRAIELLQEFPPPSNQDA